METQAPDPSPYHSVDSALAQLDGERQRRSSLDSAAEAVEEQAAILQRQVANALPERTRGSAALLMAELRRRRALLNAAREVEDLAAADQVMLDELFPERAKTRADLREAEIQSRIQLALDEHHKLVALAQDSNRSKFLETALTAVLPLALSQLGPMLEELFGKREKGLRGWLKAQLD